MKEIVFKFYVWNGDWKHIEEYNRFEVDDSKVLTSDDMDKDAIQDYLGSEDYKNKSKGDLTNIYYETSLEDETGKTLQQIGMWASDYRKEKEIDMDNIPEAISRYIITEISYEFYPNNKYDRPEYHLHEGVVCEEGEWIDPHIKGIYKTEEEARKAFEKYETDIKTDISSIECGSGVRGLRVTEYYLHGVTFDLGEAIREVDDINSEEDFDKQLEEDYWCCEAQEYHDIEEEWFLAVSPMDIVVAVYNKKNITYTERYVLFHEYNDAAEFEEEFLRACVLKPDWMTKMYFNSKYVETISEDEFMDWFKDYSGLDVKMRRTMKSSL